VHANHHQSRPNYYKIYLPKWTHTILASTFLGITQRVVTNMRSRFHFISWPNCVQTRAQMSSQFSSPIAKRNMGEKISQSLLESSFSHFCTVVEGRGRDLDHLAPFVSLPPHSNSIDWLSPCSCASTPSKSLTFRNFNFLVRMHIAIYKSLLCYTFFLANTWLSLCLWL